MSMVIFYLVDVFHVVICVPPPISLGSNSDAVLDLVQTVTPCEVLNACVQ